VSLTQQELQLQMPLDLFAIRMKINYVFFIGFPPIFMIILFLGVILSHRFAGPLKRIKRDMDAIAESGDIEKRLYVRKDDDIKPVVDSINHLLDSISKKRE
jgi:methyl-accepting chemotaxis protein